MKNQVKIPYQGHPVSALFRLHLVMTVRSLSAVFVNWILILPIVTIVLGRDGWLPLLSDKVALIVCLVAYLIVDFIVLGFREHDDNMFHYDFVNRYGNHKLIYFTVYDFLVFVVNIAIIALSVYGYLNGKLNSNLYPCGIAGVFLPFIVAQFPAIRGIKKLSCKKCRRANILRYESSGATTTQHKIDYKTVAGYDRKAGEISYEGNTINIIQHVSRHKEFDGISRIDTHSENYVCPICGYRKMITESSRKKIL